jgi:hypothetical protein
MTITPGEEGLFHFANQEYEEYQSRSERMKELHDEATKQLHLLKV